MPKCKYDWPEAGERKLIGKRISRIDGPDKASGKAKIVTFSTAYSMVEPKFMDELPYTIAYVDLEEGIRMMTRIVDCKPEDIHFDMDVEVLFHERNGYFLPYFRPAGKK